MDAPNFFTYVLAAAWQLDGSELLLIVRFQGGLGRLEEGWILERKGFDIWALIGMSLFRQVFCLVYLRSHCRATAPLACILRPRGHEAYLSRRRALDELGHRRGILGGHLWRIAVDVEVALRRGSALGTSDGSSELAWGSAEAQPL